MRIVAYGGAVSLDGFLAGADGSIDWLHFSKDVQQVMTDHWKDVDTILMGRKTYLVSVAQGRQSPKKPAKSVDDPGVELVAADATEFVRDLKRRPGKRICLMGGGELAQPLLAAGLVEEIGLNIHPVLLGAGIPTFRDPGHRVKLTLTECRQLEGGCILARYKALHHSVIAGLPPSIFPLG
jgi:dihydrofolate reductase